MKLYQKGFAIACLLLGVLLVTPNHASASCHAIFFKERATLEHYADVPTALVDASRVPLLDSTDFKETAENLLTDDIESPETLAALNKAILATAAKQGYPYIHIGGPVINKQRCTLAYLITEATVGNVSVEGAKHFPQGFYRHQLRLKHGERINRYVLEEDMEALNRNVFINQATVAFKPGKQAGQTDVVLSVNEKRVPLRASVQYSNQGTENTGFGRITFGAQWGSVLGTGHQLNYQFTGNPAFNKLQAHYWGYQIPLARRQSLSLSATLSEVNADVAAPFNQEGKNWSLASRYTVPLKPIRQYRHQLSTGVDFKRSNNDLLVGGITVSDSVSEVMQLALSYTGNMRDKRGQTRLSGQLFVSPGNITPQNNGRSFKDRRAGTTATYAYGRASLARIQYLPFGMSLTLDNRAQVASNRLLGSERFGVTGTNAVRGYRDNSVFGDHGLLFRQELNFPPLKLPTSKKLASFQQQIYPFVFHDAGIIYNKSPRNGEFRRHKAQSIGVGLRHYFRQNMFTQLMGGYRLRSLPVENDAGGVFVHIMANVAL